MKLGIKVGLKGDSYSDLLKTQPDFCEIWFNANKTADYDTLFSQIKSLNIKSGLHFWGATRNQILANLAYPDNNIIEQSLDLMQKTINIACKNRCEYVNIHPGQAMLTKVDFESEPIKFMAYGKTIDWKIAGNTLKKSLIILSKYAKSKNVKLFIESVPKNCYSLGNQGKLDRINYLYMAEIPLPVVEQMLSIDNLYFTNDFGHTIANIVTDDRKILLDYLFQKTKKLLAKTKLIHVGYIIQPYNGTDYHGSLRYPEIQTLNAVPNNLELTRLLQIYKNQNVWALTEPETDHVGNFIALKKMVDKSLK